LRRSITYTLASLVKTVRRHALDTTVTAEEFLNAFIVPYIEAGDVRNRNKKLLSLDKSRTSRILAGKDDVPVALRRSLHKTNLEHEAAKRYIHFIDDYIDPLAHDLIIREVIALVEENETLRASLESATENLSSFLARSVYEAIKASNNQQTKKILWKSGPDSIELVTGDVLRYGFRNRSKRKCIVVIPVNTTFETRITRRFEGNRIHLVSDSTLHGQWLARIIDTKVNTKNLSKRITRSLKRQGFSADACNEYPIGSIAEIETTNAVYYLLAVSRFEKDNVAHSTSESIFRALTSLAVHYDARGQGNPLYIPLIGTGRSRSGITPKESLNLIKQAFLHDGRGLYGNVHIVVHPANVSEFNLGDDAS